MEKGQGKEKDTLQTDKVFTRKEYIEREAAIKAVCDSSAHTCNLKNCFHGCQEAQAILAIPSADVAPVRHGRWISDHPGKRFGTMVKLDKDGCPVETCHCSECGDWLTASDEYPARGRYCPNCGALMDDKDGDGDA